MSERDGGPAFPFVTHEGEVATGMTLLDYMAAHAMQGILANTDAIEGLLSHADDPHGMVATGAYKLASAMLKEKARNQ